MLVLFIIHDNIRLEVEGLTRLYQYATRYHSVDPHVHHSSHSTHTLPSQVEVLQVKLLFSESALCVFASFLSDIHIDDDKLVSAVISLVSTL